MARRRRKHARPCSSASQSNGQHLLGLINDVLDLSKIEAGQLTLSLTDYSIKDVVHNVYGAVESLATAQEARLQGRVANGPAAGHGDERRLTQVLLNLVGNAIKFTDTGEVAIKASIANGSFTVAVHDTGPGIADGRSGARFSRSSSRPTTRPPSRRAAPGSGLRSPSGSSRCTAAGSGSSPSWGTDRRSPSRFRSRLNSR